ncbi:alpha-ketoacid dehydrogenase subunit alpha/beta [Salinibacter ruber]|uniref:alpha-ketoacid dehydrogenase subunit alpha/beta n=1 Tax=Salinibacter ruber TaxID=146919 RepID=UPI002167B011|nr:dehydrogenase E1 component subunit alpha/beta [Salinibacter ruber]MCS3755693.1 2-oxoisovalerate dehydrogenase E1 component [Salinibacter ruber]MCS4085663.1 2-oxoisovalerate dehydrogenase E1 component [Salinibacter ruber]
MATPEMQDTNDSDRDTQTNASSSSSGAAGGVETAAEEIPAENLMHGDGHAAIPQIPSITSDGSIEVDELSPADFEPDDLRQRLRTMMLSRRLDEKMMTLLKQGEGHFHIGCAGHEAVQSALSRYSRPGEGPGHDWFCFYYRDLCMALSLGMTTKEALLAHLAKADDPNSGGRQMPEHFGLKHLNVMTTASSVGAQFNPGVGFGFGIQQRGEDSYVYISCGDGATSQGDFHEALNWAAREQAPALFLVQDNKYAISVPIEEQTAGGTPYKLAAGYEGLSRMRVDGTDFFASAAAAQAAIQHIRDGKGPVCLVADVVRLLPHSSSDDHTKYRTPDELEADRKIDPIDRLEAALIGEGILTEADAEALQEEVHEEVDEATEWAKRQDDPSPETAGDHVFFEGDLGLDYNSEDDLDEDAEPMVMVDAINRTLKEEMARDESVIVYGEDVAGDKGGVFTATKDLTDEFGGDRCFNSPLAEGSIIGTAVGYAASGFTPVVEIQFADYIWPAMQQLRNQVAPFRYRSDGEWSCPMVVRVPCGGYIHGGLCHSQNIESIFGHTPGLKVALPSTAADAKGLLATAIRSEDPVLFLEHKALYRAASARTPTPPEDYTLPFGEARIAREGADMTIVTYGMMTQKSLNVAEELDQEGVDVEVVDLRTIVPLDSETILESVRKTNRALVVYEDHEFIGFGAELSAQIADDAFTYLDAPIRRVAGEFTPIPFAHSLERSVLPSDEGILEAARDLAAF